MCGRPLCIACVVLVRGVLVGPECLPAVLEDPPPLDGRKAAAPPGGDRLALAGFGLVAVLSIFPWSRFVGPRWFGAWTLHWSLLAVLGGVLGLGLALAARRRPLDPRGVAAAYAVLAVAVTIGAYLHHRHPPPLAGGTFVDWLALSGGVLALLGAATKTLAVLRARRWRP